MAKMFVHYAGTVTAFKAAGLESKYNNHIVFIAGGADGKGAAVYTHGNYYGDYKAALADLKTKVDGLKYFSKISDGTNTASVASADGTITFSATDPSEVSVDVNAAGVKIGLSEEFKTKVNTTLPGQISAVNTKLGEKDAVAASGDDATAFGRIKNLENIVGDLIGAGEGEVESVDVKINKAIEALDVDAKAGDFVASISQVDGKIAPVMGTFNFDAKGDAAKAETAAKAYADSLAKNYEVAGEAAKAEAAAKKYADDTFQVKGDYEAAGAAAAVQGNLDSHVADAVAHVTADERTAWNAAKTAIDAFLKDADMTADAVDTLKELQTYMTTDGEAAAKVVERIGKLEAINHDAYKAADEATLASAKSYADGLAGNYDAAGAAAGALNDAKAYVDGKVDGKFDTVGSAAQALTDAKAYADGKFQVAGNYETAGAAAAAEQAAKSYADGLAVNYATAAQGAKADAAAPQATTYTKAEVDDMWAWEEL
jgi:hypothetical protein